MRNFLEIKNRRIEYTHRISRRSKSIRLTVYPGGRIIVTTPRGVGEAMINDVIAKKSDWILRQFDLLKDIKVVDPTQAKREYLENKEKAQDLVNGRLKYFNQFYNYSYRKASIGKAKSLWGSCSRKGNLSFNYKIIFLDNTSADYIIVHELCHLKEFNHSRQFWDLVAKTIPDYLLIKKNLRQLGLGFR